MKNSFCILFFITLLAGCVAADKSETALTRDPVVAEEIRILEEQGRQIAAQMKEEREAAERSAPVAADSDSAGENEEDSHSKMMLNDDILEIEVWFADGKSQLPGFPYKKKVPKSGKVFMPFAGVFNAFQKTDVDIEEFMNAYFAKIVKLNRQRLEAQLAKEKEMAAQIAAETANEAESRGRQDGASFILPGDLLTIEVWLYDRTTQFTGFPFSREVPEEGKCFIPHIGMQQVADRTIEVLRRELTTAFSSIIEDPIVVVQRKVRALLTQKLSEQEDARRRAAYGTMQQTVVDDDPVPQEIRGILEPPVVLAGHSREVHLNPQWRALATTRRFVIMGRISNPGLYPLEGELTLREAIAVAGGTARYAANTRIIIVRGQEVITVNFKDLMEGADVSNNIQIQPQDAIFVPATRIWKTADAIQTVFLPVTAMRDALFVYDRWRE